MASKQQKSPGIKEKLTALGYTDGIETKLGQENVLMLYIDGHLISGVEYALSLSDEALKAHIDETVQVVGEGEQD